VWLRSLRDLGVVVFIGMMDDDDDDDFGLEDIL
jgi:hypothetical protein